MEDDAQILWEIRQRMAERSEPADDMTDDQLRVALRITLVGLAEHYVHQDDDPVAHD